MPLSNHRGLVSRGLEQFGKRLLVSVELVTVGDKAIQVAVLASLNHSSTGATNRVGHIAALKSHSPFRDSIHVRCYYSRRIVGTERLLAVIIGENENDVGLSIGCE